MCASCPWSHMKGPLTTSSMISLMATTRRMRERGTMVVNRPVGDTPGNCFTKRRRIEAQSDSLLSLVPRSDIWVWEQDRLLLYLILIQQLLGARKWLGISPCFHIVVVTVWPRVSPLLLGPGIGKHWEPQTYSISHIGKHWEPQTYSISHIGKHWEPQTYSISHIGEHWEPQTYSISHIGEHWES